MPTKAKTKKRWIIFVCPACSANLHRLARVTQRTSTTYCAVADKSVRARRKYR